MNKNKLKKWMKHKNTKVTVAILTAGVAIFLIIGYYSQQDLLKIYQHRKAMTIQDRTGEIIFTKANSRGYWNRYTNNIPTDFKKLLLKKEDQLYHYHFGINPLSTFRAARSYFGLGPKLGSSTITQQLVKILLGNESERTLSNKITETFYTLSLETFQSKEQILEMYINSAYFGNQARGLAEASHLYFDTPPHLLSKGQIVQLVTTLNSPSSRNPSQPVNKRRSKKIAPKLNLNPSNLSFTRASEVRKNMKEYSHYSQASFEVKSLVDKSVKTTIDKNLTKKIRGILQAKLEKLKTKNAKSGAVVVIKLPENELLTIVGSPDPNSNRDGHKINMATEARPIGSTIKPFIYLKAFEKGARPYTLVNDREYKYITERGFPLYPKNFDYKYRGTVSLHYALSNSLNVPTVKALEFVKLDNFYQFLRQELEFKPVRDLEEYKLSIALGGLETDLLTLSKYFTIFPDQGTLKPLKVKVNQETSEKQVAKPKHIQLINKILSDRKTGINQFGLQSNFNLFQKNYALKTGTSQNFKDSWVIGYTPDFLVGVWVGNPSTESMKQITGQRGAGKVWAEVMELMLNSEYNKKTPFNFSQVESFQKQEQTKYGLAGDNYQQALNLLTDHKELILKPHPQDQFLLESDTQIILEAKKEVSWFVNDKFINKSRTTRFSPHRTGAFKIRASTPKGTEEEVTIQVNAKR